MFDTPTRVILKYPNRRLYDTDQHRYVTLKNLRELVLRDVSFVIRDRRNQADLTYPTLLSLLGEGAPILSREFLLNAIRNQSRAGRAEAAAEVSEPLSGVGAACAAAQAGG
jgi:polyhydroxyalkanoate synthesis repressor PhaR